MMSRDKNSYAGYIFDFDGTLVHSMEAHYDAWRASFKAHNGPFEFDKELFISMGGMGLQETVIELNRRFNCAMPADDIVKLKEKILAENLELIRPAEELFLWCEELSARGSLIAIASGGKRAMITRVLELLGKRHLFSFIVTQEDVQRGKPNPDIFLLAAQKLALGATDCLVIEDSPLGVEAAKRAGMDCWHIPAKF